MIIFVNHAGLESVFLNPQVNFLMVGLTAALGEATLGFFFMLSGFVLTWSARPGERPGLFHRRRLVKIFPNHLTTWLIGLVAMLVVGAGIGWHLLPSLVLVQAWFPSVDTLEGTNGPSWSLSAELVFYLAFPWVLRLVNRIAPGRLWWWVGGLTAAAAVVPLLSLLLPAEPNLFGFPLPFWRFWFICFLPPVRALEFLLGMVVARIVIERRWPGIRARWGFAALGAGWAVGLALPPPYGFVAPFIPGLVMLLCAAATTDLSGRRTALNHPGMVQLGDLSFPFYLLHWLVLHYTHLALGGGSWGAPAAIAFIVGALLLTGALAWVLHHTVELPMERRFSRPRRIVPQPAATSST